MRIDSPKIASTQPAEADITPAPDAANDVAPVTNGMSIDVEEYFQVWALSSAANRDDWDTFPSRVELSVDTVLQMLENADASATFFILGWIAERHPQMVRRIADSGHEIASHGYEHTKVVAQTPAEFRADVARAKGILEDVSGQVVRGYRAPSFSIGQRNLWALDVLEETGHRYSSSIYPISHDHYGMPDASRFAFRRTAGGILEIPLSTVHAFGRNLPCGGGGYFRLGPYAYFRWALKRLNSCEAQSAVFYFHPWELDPGQPRLRNLSAKSRFRHYVNLGGMATKLARLLGDFRWDRMDRIFLGRDAA